MVSLVVFVPQEEDTWSGSQGEKNVDGKMGSEMGCGDLLRSLFFLSISWLSIGFWSQYQPRQRQGQDV
jgi:hypothetical protein